MPARREAVSHPGVPGLLQLLQSLLAAGYAIFAVAHSSQPRYTIDDIRPDLPRAVRFIRHHADCFGVNPQRIGILGGSSGGHVSLLTAIGPPAPQTEAEDPVDRESSRVQAVVAYFPPTDLLNYGRGGTTVHEYFTGIQVRWDAPFDFHRYDKDTQSFERVTDAEERQVFFRQNSPITHVSADTPPPVTNLWSGE